MHTLMRRALTPLALVLLAACGDGADKAAEPAAETAAPSSRTLAAALRDDGAFGEVAANAGLTSVLEGVGPYTVFAPAAAALGADTAGADFRDQSLRAEAAALTRAHIVPGALTRQDIRAAIERDSDGSVQMRTMAEGLLTFSRDGEAIVVTADNGARARLTGEEAVVSNGVVQPVDALLVRPAQGQAANQP